MALNAPRILRPSAEVADEASYGLWRRNPAQSARRVIDRRQLIVVVILALVVVTALIVWPATTASVLIAILGLFFLISTGFKLVVALRGARFDLVRPIRSADIRALDVATLPRYTVLVPVFREANIVHRLVASLGRLDYPKDRLEVLVLVEEGDDATLQAVQASDPPEWFTVVVVPAGTPQTKPRACNAGLQLATGEYLVIYDAEDEPEPAQLKKAIIEFARSGEETIVVQAALNYFNAKENVLTRMFTLEYSYWFDYMLPGLAVAGLPIPLGGTSNHFRTEALRRLGGWDPFNVTEDADLGIRASAEGYRVGVVDSTTLEEANTSIPNFIRQRSRWIKGYLQTVLVHSRHPLRLIRAAGLREFVGFALLIGGTPISFLAMLPMLAAFCVVPFIPADVRAGFLVGPALWFGLADFLVGNVVMLYLNMLGPYKRGRFWLVGWSLLNPLYWVLHSIAAYKALWQLIVRPHYWEKTEHGLTEQH